ncbi:hypothetical protein TRAPUB_1049, partial [Trametes pubescens]
MELVCLGCGSTFTNSQAYSTHKAQYCIPRSDLGKAVSKRKAKAEAERIEAHARKRARREEEENARMEEDTAPEVIEPPVPVPPDPATVSRVGRARMIPRKFKDLMPSSYAGLPAHIRAVHPVHPSRIPTPAPALPPPVLEHVAGSLTPQSQQGTPEVEQPRAYKTKPDHFGLYRVYAYKPQRDPANTTWEAICDESLPAPPSPTSSLPPRIPSGLKETTTFSPPVPYGPFPNVTTFDLLHWQYDSSNTKLNEQLNGLARVMQQPGFNPADLAKFDASHEVQRLDTYTEDVDGSPLSARDGWVNGSVAIRLPKEKVRYTSEEAAPTFTVTGVYYRPLVDVIQSAYQQPCVKDWHFIPYEEYWIPPADTTPSQPSPTPSGSPSPISRILFAGAASDSESDSSTSSSESDSVPQGIRVRTEIYDSDAMLADDAEMRRQPREAGDPDDLEYAIAPLLIWTDGTHLANFGTASLWPGYGYSGSQSKYTRGKPTAFAAHHFAYIPSLPATLQDIYIQIYGIPATSDMLTFLKRELMQKIWLLLLDDRFMYSYVHGLLMLCGDEIRRRMFPRFHIHSADYVEKILQACLKYFAKCPCPRCCINKDKILEMGTRNDLYRRNRVRVDNDDLHFRIKLTRRWIFEQGVPLTSVYMKRMLDPLSITPTRNAFSIRLRQYGFNFYSLYVPDLLHEFELGVWKSVFTHLLRILYAAGGDAIQELNRRFRRMPTFGRIRKFSDNIADQRKLAARDYENNLRCSIPAIEAMLEAEDDDIVSDMLFDLNTWHCLAKLRKITDPQITSLEHSAVDVGSDVRRFAKVTCEKYKTVDLPKEAAARGRRKAALAKKTGKVTVGKQTREPRRRRVFNMNTYKFHALRDYPATIRLHATTDNWSTQTGELEHRHVKRFYARTNKHKHELQIAQHTQRAEKLRIIKARVDAARKKLNTPSAQDVNGDDAHPCAASSPAHNEDNAPSESPQENAKHVAYGSPSDRYHIAESQRENDDITAWVSAHRGDPAFK